jgi:hypothetical protein
MSSTGTYVRAGLPEVSTALAALTGEPHPLAPGGHAPTSTTLKALSEPLSEDSTH